MIVSNMVHCIELMLEGATTRTNESIFKHVGFSREFICCHFALGNQSGTRACFNTSTATAREHSALGGVLLAYLCCFLEFAGLQSTEELHQRLRIFGQHERGAILCELRQIIEKNF